MYSHSYYRVVGKLHPANTGPKVRIFRENNHHLYPVDVYLCSLTNSNNSSLPTMAVRRSKSSCLHAVPQSCKRASTCKEASTLHIWLIQGQNVYLNDCEANSDAQE